LFPQGYSKLDSFYHSKMSSNFMRMEDTVNSGGKSARGLALPGLDWCDKATKGPEKA